MNILNEIIVILIWLALLAFALTPFVITYDKAKKEMTEADKTEADKPTETDIDDDVKIYEPHTVTADSADRINHNK